MPSLLALALASAGAPVAAQVGVVIQTPTVPQELPVEVEIELAPAASLKQAPLWKELIQFLEHPYGPDDVPGTADDGTIVRRPGFGAVMPALRSWPLDYNFLTGQPLRLRTNDGEVSWDQPGPLFDPDEDVATNEFNVPVELRTAIGALVGSDDDVLDAGEVSGTAPCSTCGYLLVSNPGGHPAIPPDGTAVAVPAVVDGVLHEYDPATGELEEVTELETPINEVDFLRPASDVAGAPSPLRPYVGRLAAETLGKALFWDMQVGSDGVQSCGSCHFHAGADNRTRNQLNPNHLNADFTLQVKGPNQDVVAADFPFHKLADPDVPGEPLLNPGNVVSDANDVLSSMGVSRFKLFLDIPPIGLTAFGPPVGGGLLNVLLGVRPLLPDLGDDTVAEPIAAFVDPVTGQKLRRVEPRNTPTMHSAAFNFDNFWDGRARFHFNGGSVFGPSDPAAHVFIDPGSPGGTAAVNLQATTNGHVRPELLEEDPEVAEQPIRIKFSSLASQAVGPPVNDFEMSFSGRNWAKIGKKLLQGELLPMVAPLPLVGVTPLANQLVATTDSRLGPFSNQGGQVCQQLGRLTAAGRPGLCITYADLIRLSFKRQYWHNSNRHLNGCFTDGRTPACPAGTLADPFDGYVLRGASGAASASNRNQFRQIEANFSLFFALAVQMYEQLLIPDDTPVDRFFDANPLAANGIGEPGSINVLHPALVRDLVGGSITLVPDDPATPEYDGFGPDELFGFDVFAGANLTAALSPAQAVGRSGVNRNPAGMGSNPFARSAKCMLCHLGPEQTDHTINIAHGLLKGDAEYEFPTPPVVPDPRAPLGCDTPDCLLPAPEPTGPLAAVRGFILEEEIEFAGAAQDAVEVEPRSFALLDDPATPWDDRIVAQPAFFAFGDQGIYNIGLRPSEEDPGRGGDDPFGWPLSLSALTLKNIEGADFEPCDGPGDSCAMGSYDPNDPGGTFEESGDGSFFFGTTHTLESINPGFERDPIEPRLPEYLSPWVNGLPAGELHPTIDELAGLGPNVVTPPNGGPAVEFTEYMFGDDLHCGVYDPITFGFGPPSFGWGAIDPVTGLPVPGLCPNNQSGVSGNLDYPLHGTWPVPNRVLRRGTFKAPQLRNVELTGPYFHTGSYLTLRQVIDFYMRGGDFPITNEEDRDPHIVDVGRQAFAFGRTTGDDLAAFADALPDPAYAYDAMPDTDHALTPEPATSTPEDAKVALVRFLIALTDPRVKYERAPFDRPELFVPVDGRAGDNTGGRAQLLSQSSGATPLFRRIPAVGAGGHAAALPAFLDVSSTPVAGTNNDHFDR